MPEPQPIQRTPPPAGITLREIAGLADILESAQEIETATREDAWLGITQVIGGARLRIMTVRDYTALLQFQNPLLSRTLPAPAELSFFLWVLSPEMEHWYEPQGWRKLPFMGRVQQWQSRRHGRRVREALQLASLERSETDWHAKAPAVPFVAPDDHPFTLATRAAFKYVDALFLDRPASLKRDTGKSGLCYLTSWFDLLQSEYHLPTEEIWRMKIPVLFSRIKAIQMRRNRNLPEFNVDRDKIMQNIMQGLRLKKYTEDDLRAGRVDLQTNKLRNN